MCPHGLTALHSASGLLPSTHMLHCSAMHSSANARLAHVISPCCNRKCAFNQLLVQGSRTTSNGVFRWLTHGFKNLARFGFGPCPIFPLRADRMTGGDSLRRCPGKQLGTEQDCQAAHAQTPLSLACSWLRVARCLERGDLRHLVQHAGRRWVPARVTRPPVPGPAGRGQPFRLAM